MKDFKGKVTKEWIPTFENVAREFITDNMYRLMFDEKLANIRFEFREEEAMEFVKKVLDEWVEDIYLNSPKAEKILNKLENVRNHSVETQNIDDQNLDKPIVVVKDYKKFFELLRQFFEKNIELYFERTKSQEFSKHEKNNCFEQIWLRMTPSDFNNPEEFLEKQVQMLDDKTFEKYNKMKYLGELDGLAICAEKDIARTWDENSYQMEFTAFVKSQYDNRGKRDLSLISHYKLPFIRYGIYEKDGKKVCRIGSIQNKNDNHIPNEVDKKVNRVKYKANQGVQEEDTEKVEPKNLLALSIFINMLNQEGITEIEVPSFYVLDYEYHEKLSKEIKDEFDEEWPEEEIERYPDIYESQKQHFDSLLDKQDIISELKTERLLLTFRRLLQHYPNGKMQSYAEDGDSFMHLSIPKVRDENDINGNIFKKIYQMQNQNYIER